MAKPATWTITALSACTTHTRKQDCKEGRGKKGTKYSETQGLIPCVQELDKDGDPTGNLRIQLAANGEVELAPSYSAAIKKVKDDPAFEYARFDRDAFKKMREAQAIAEAKAKVEAEMAAYDDEVEAELEDDDESSESEEDGEEASDAE